MPNLHILAGLVIVVAVIYGLVGTEVEFPGEHRVPGPAQSRPAR